MSKNCKIARITQDLGDQWNEQGVENMPDVAEWGKRLGVSQRTVYYWVSHIINRAKANREAKAWHLSALGWTQRDIGERLGVDHKTISNDLGKNCSFAKIPQDLGEQWNEQGVAVGTVNSMCKIAVLQNCTPTSASSGTSRYLWI